MTTVNNDVTSGRRRILLSGSSGLIGQALWQELEAAGHTVVPLLRRPIRSDRTATDLAATPMASATWDPASGKMDLTTAGKLDAVVHLAGETIGQRWTRSAKQRILASRVVGTRLLSETLAGLPEPPSTLAVASAIGYYGNRGEGWLDEESSPGQGFLADVTRQWEEASTPARARGLRLIHFRLGIVLAAQGGALQRMLPAFRLGLGGRLGDGRHYWSWITLTDAVRGIRWLLETDACQGKVNLVAPNPVTNEEFTKALGDVLGRPTIMTVPKWAIRLLFGEMGREALLGSARVTPARLLEAGFEFRHRDLEAALREVLKVERQG